MNQSQTSRRSFLGSLAILSAGAAFGSVTNFFSASPDADLQQQWKEFCRQHGGRVATGALPGIGNAPVPSKGHCFQHDAVIFFPDHNVLAQPTWIYWQEEKARPADVIITFYRNDEAKSKLCRLNRFELKALQALPAADEQKDGLALLKEMALHRSSSRPAPLSVKTTVQRGQRVHIFTRVSEKETLLTKQLI
ncbi:MAG TPA: hypothetical protein VFT06_05755, partial [Flavisolibacter sp.]|nr:hypothetical protein [Flavisolibacter sp.]